MSTSTTSRATRTGVLATLAAGAVAALAVLAGLVAAPAGAQDAPAESSGRYTDLVFASVATSTATYATAPALVGGAPTALRLDVHQPVGDTLATRPAIVWIHGGGFVGGHRADLADIATAYARRGYVTFSIDYRLDRGSRCGSVQDGVTDPQVVARCADESRHGLGLYYAHQVTVDASWTGFLKARLGLP